MNLSTFLEQRAPQWAELDALVARAGRHPERLDAPSILRLGACYRAAAADLAYARRRFPGDPVVGQLAQRVAGARHAVYDVSPRRRSLVQFATRGYWRRVAEDPVALAIAAVMLFAPAALAWLWAHHDPAAAAGVLPGPFRRTQPGSRPRGASLGLSTAQQAAFATQIFTNNIKVTFEAFAGGMLAGLLTLFVLIQNGVILGVVGSLSIDAHQGARFLRLVAPHGVLELSCIAVAGAAGLRLGWSIVAPGRRRRGEALVREARRTIELVLGTAVWLIVAGIVEGFVTPRGLGSGPALAVGLGLGALYWVLVVTRGRVASDASALFGSQVLRDAGGTERLGPRLDHGRAGST